MKPHGVSLSHGFPSHGPSKTLRILFLCLHDWKTVKKNWSIFMSKTSQKPLTILLLIHCLLFTAPRCCSWHSEACPGLQASNEEDDCAFVENKRSMQPQESNRIGLPKLNDHVEPNEMALVSSIIFLVLACVYPKVLLTSIILHFIGRFLTE